MAEAKWIPDLQSSRIFWLQLEHFDLDTTCGVWPERIQFQLLSAYDVVAAPGWCIGTPRQPWCEIWLIREGQVEVIQDEISATVRAGEIAILTGGRSRLSTESIGVPLSLIGFSCDAKIWNALDFIALLDLPLQVKPNAIVHQAIAGNLQLLLDECRTSDRLGELAAHALAQTVFVQVLRTIFSKEDFEKNCPLHSAPKSPVHWLLSLTILVNISICISWREQHTYHPSTSRENSKPQYLSHRWNMCVASAWSARKVCWQPVTPQWGKSH